MNDSSSPTRPSVVVTYLERQKRKRPASEALEDPFDSSSATGAALHQPHDILTGADDALGFQRMSTAKPRSRQTPLGAADASVPTSKRLRCESDASTRSATSTRAAKSHSTSLAIPNQSISPAKTPPKGSPSIATVTTMEPPSSKRPVTPELEIDDDGSVAESAQSVKAKRRSEPERLLYFKDQPHCGKLEPHQAECTRCGKVINLGRAQTYAIRPWENHRRRCDFVFASNAGGNTGSDGEEDAENNTGSPLSPLRLSVEERKAFLNTDPNVLDFKHEEVTCRNCYRTIKLSSRQSYQLKNWQKHRKNCCETSLNNRIDMASLKQKIVNDPQVESFGSRHVVCVICKNTIVSNGEDDYTLNSWEEHKTTCAFRPHLGHVPSEGNGMTPIVSTVPFPTQPPPSSASTMTEHTLIANDTRQDSHSEKRMRGDSVASMSVDPVAQPSNNLATGEDDCGTVEEPSVTGWMMLPLRAFVRGFRESLKRA